VIKINLALKKQSDAAVTDSRGRRGGGLNFGNIDLERLKDLPINKIIIPLVIGLAANYGLEFYKDGEIQKLSVVAQKYRSEGDKWRTDLQKFKGYDEVKKQLDADDSAIRNKLNIIQKLMGTRSVAGASVIILSKTIPPGVWLRDLKYEESGMHFTGSALEYNQISDFMKALTESVPFANVELKGTEQGTDKDIGAEIENFEIAVERR